MANQDQDPNHLDRTLRKQLTEDCITYIILIHEVVAGIKSQRKNQSKKRVQNIVQRKRRPHRNEFHHSNHRSVENFHRQIDVVHPDQNHGMTLHHGIEALAIWEMKLNHGHHRSLMHRRI